MRIAFYAPLKPPDHPLPSGDRQMARSLVRALERAGHQVEIASELRSFSSRPEPDHYAAVEKAAKAEAVRLSAAWKEGGAPDLWFCYHPYYKAPDLIGPGLARTFGISYVTAEASYSARRNSGAWAVTQAKVAEAVREQRSISALHIEIEKVWLQLRPMPNFAMLPPFIDSAPPLQRIEGDPTRLVAVAMMRPGDKLDSYRMLARALERLVDLQWTLAVVGDGPCRAEVTAEFAGLPPEHIEWLGQLAPGEVPAALAGCGIYVWPGCGEAYGLAYLEAQAAGLPVVAQDTAGVPEVVLDGQTGILTAAGDITSYADAIERLLVDDDERKAMGEAARRFVLGERSLDAAAVRLAAILPKEKTQ